MRIQGTRSPRNRRGLDIPGGHAVIRLVNYKATDKSLSPYLANGHVPHVVCHLKKVVGLLVDPKSESQIHISASVEDLDVRRSRERLEMQRALVRALRDGIFPGGCGIGPSVAGWIS
jgi:hypothetical protein